MRPGNKFILASVFTNTANSEYFASAIELHPRDMLRGDVCQKTKAFHAFHAAISAKIHDSPCSTVCQSSTTILAPISAKKTKAIYAALSANHSNLCSTNCIISINPPSDQSLQQFLNNEQQSRQDSQQRNQLKHDLNFCKH
jgi:hypothetical protein